MEWLSILEEAPLWRWVRRNVAVLVFLGLSTVAMYGIYFYYNPATQDESAVASAASSVVPSQSLATTITKPIADRPVTQRFNQTAPPLDVAIIVGHRESDSGAVCPDGLTELEINTLIAEQTANNLLSAGVDVTLFDEFDDRMLNFTGTLVVSLHADSCQVLDSSFTGYKVAGSSQNDSTRLVRCLEEQYAITTNMTIHENTITEQMTNYHAFRTLGPAVPAAIVETGFMYNDREILTTGSAAPAAGIANGILCYLQS